MNKIIFYTIVLMFLICSGNSYSQLLSIAEQDKQVNETEEIMTVPANKEFSHTAEGLKIVNEMIRLKSEVKTGNGEKLLELQKKLERIEYTSVTKTFDAGELRFSDNHNQKTNQFHTDAITISAIYSTYNSYIKAIATQVEQTAPGTGTIWVAFAVGTSDSGAGAAPDTLLLYKSVNDGLIYRLYSRLTLSTGNKINIDEMDMEIIESPASKFIYLTAGFSANGYTGVYRNALVVFDIVNNVSSSVVLNFPGTVSSSKYYRARITSDNARYALNAYVTISVIQDSTDGFNHYYMTKFCRIINPYTTTPAITYLPAALYLPLIYAPFSSTVHADIAYYNTGGNAAGDSLIFVLSGFPGALEKIFIYKGYSNTAVYPALSKILSGTLNDKQFVRVASTGGNDQKKMMMIFMESEGSVNSSLYTYTTSDANNWSKSLVQGGAFGVFQLKNSDITGQRNVSGKFYAAFKIDSPLIDIIGSMGYNDLTRTSFVLNHNNIGGKTDASPKPAFRYNNTDSCLTIWSAASSVNSSCGCSVINAAVRFYIQGLYDEITNLTKYDLAKIYLRNSVSPYSKVDSALGLSGTIFTFHNANPGSYYVSVTHRNSVETWYYQPVALVYSNNVSVDMMTIQSRAFGSNQIQIDNSPVRFGIYSGDVNQDGTVDLTDGSLIDNDAINFASGYLPTDLNGDGIIDVADAVFADNNSFNFVSKITP